MDQMLVDKLAVLKPVNWATTIMRHEILKALHEKGRFSMALGASNAAKLNITPRFLYMLLRQYELEVGGAPIVEKASGPDRILDVRCENLIAATIAELGMSTKPNVIAREVGKRRSRDNLPYVSDRTVRHRIDALAGRDRLRNLFQKDCEYLLDACSLKLQLKTREHDLGVAHLIGLFDVRYGTLIAHNVTFGAPDAGQICELLSFIPSTDLESSVRVGMTTSLSPFSEEIRGVLKAEAVSLRAGLRTSGLGFRNFFGRRIGKIDISYGFRDEIPYSEPVTLAEAEQVISAIAARSAAGSIAS